jgi:Carboxypeptidase regulatory-like domain
MKSSNHLDDLRIASPCPVGWAQMTGDDRVRFCEQCSLRVYNISAMTRIEAETLIANTEGRICARLFRRSDGTIITKDCPVGLRAIRRRVAKVAGAAFAAIVGLWGSAAGQNPSKDKSSCQPQVTVTKSTPDTKPEASSISGKVVDPNGAAVPGVKVRIAKKGGEAVNNSQTDEKGLFQFRGLKSDVYELGFESKGFSNLKITEIKLGDKDPVTISAILIPKGVDVVMGVVGSSSPLDTPPGTTIFSGETIRKLPIPQ